MSGQAAVMKNVHVSYGPVKALDGFNIDIPFQGVHGLLGRNGAGKTTAIRAMAGLLAVSGGSVSVLGADPGEHGEVRRRISVLFGEDGLVPSLTVLENLEVWCGFYGFSRADSKALAERSLKSFGMLREAGTPVKGLSTGNRRAVAMARVFAVPSELVMLDEPTSSLDPVKAAEVREMLAAAAGDRPVLLSTHNLHEAQALCDTVTIVHRGRTVLAGDLGSLTRAPGFLVRTEQGMLTHLGELVSPGPDGLVPVESDLPPARLLEELIGQGNRITEFRPAGKGLEEIFMGLAGEPEE